MVEHREERGGDHNPESERATQRSGQIQRGATYLSLLGLDLNTFVGQEEDDEDEEDDARSL